MKKKVKYTPDQIRKDMIEFLGSIETYEELIKTLYDDLMEYLKDKEDGNSKTN